MKNTLKLNFPHNTINCLNFKLLYEIWSKVGSLMVRRNREGALSEEEKSVAKALLSKGERNQDIQALINIGRTATINSARITEVKQNDQIIPASDDELEFFKIKKRSFDSKTKLNMFEDERVIRAREAMMLAVQIFNSPNLYFKTEVFTVLSNISWTYILHEYYIRKGVRIDDDNGRTPSLGTMIDWHCCPLSKGIKDNLRAIKDIRDKVEHLLLGKADQQWLPLFQACCLNFEKTICELFGDRTSLQSELSVALQFGKLTMDQAITLQKYEIPQKIQAVDAQLRNELSHERLADSEYQFRVVYTMISSSKNRSHIKFLHPESEKGKAVQNVIVKEKLADEQYPYKAKSVAKLVSEKSGKPFTIYNHTQAWKKFNVRPIRADFTLTESFGVPKAVGI